MVETRRKQGETPTLPLPIQQPVSHRLANVVRLDVFTAFQVGDGAGYFSYFVESAGA